MENALEVASTALQNLKGEISMRLENKVAIVTGAGRNIGEEISDRKSVV